MDNVPTGFEVGKDYVSVVSADNYGNGVASAHLMAKALNGEGEIGIIYHAADFFVTRQRYEAFRKTIAEDYPGITIVAEQGIREPDFFDDAYQAASTMLAANPDLKGLWAVWDLPAEGVRILQRWRRTEMISLLPRSTLASTLLSTWLGIGSSRELGRSCRMTKV